MEEGLPHLEIPEKNVEVRGGMGKVGRDEREEITQCSLHSPSFSLLVFPIVLNQNSGSREPRRCSQQGSVSGGTKGLRMDLGTWKRRTENNQSLLSYLFYTLITKCYF